MACLSCGGSTWTQDSRAARCASPPHSLAASMAGTETRRPMSREVLAATRWISSFSMPAGTSLGTCMTKVHAQGTATHMRMPNVACGVNADQRSISNMRLLIWQLQIHRMVACDAAV